MKDERKRVLRRLSSFILHFCHLFAARERRLSFANRCRKFGLFPVFSLCVFHVSQLKTPCESQLARRIFEGCAINNFFLTDASYSWRLWRLFRSLAQAALLRANRRIGKQRQSADDAAGDDVPAQRLNAFSFTKQLHPQQCFDISSFFKRQRACFAVLRASFA